LAFATKALRDSDLRAPQFSGGQPRLRLIYNSPYTPWLLLLLGLIRVVVFVIAYPRRMGPTPAIISYTPRSLTGWMRPSSLRLIYPLYPLLIYIAHYVLGSIYWLIGFQLVLSALQGVIFYLGLRPYSPALGFVVALMVLGDAQTGILYNFTSTEPLYMFLLNLAFCLYLIQLKRPSDRRIQRVTFF